MKLICKKPDLLTKNGSLRKTSSSVLGNGLGYSAPEILDIIEKSSSVSLLHRKNSEEMLLDLFRAGFTAPQIRKLVT